MFFYFLGAGAGFGGGVVLGPSEIGFVLLLVEPSLILSGRLPLSP